ncbi:uncharacterized protein LOC127729096 [Mytilus californianus]|uniref:uncharacterized protein LOC127729096 n=1 Tax=Mytilus californianus TaxID=6549 RepID=UPI002245F9CE|nr:uncharacterized protein LOC127729096 [Mytilus californianus]XP_052092713.1 uncharacterized protein LOC127729096 [Mytilus californianus]XP_052092714.1 uncharacterized protein LOC127729096 [Mytilus californianus]
MEKFPCLAALGFSVSVNKRLEIDEVEDKFITNKLLLELNSIKERSNGDYTYQDVLNWISSLCGKENVTNKSLYLKVKSILLKIKTTVSKLKKSKLNSEHVENYLNLVIDTDTLLEIPHNPRRRKHHIIETYDTENISNVKSKKRKTNELKYRNKSSTWREANRKLNFKLQNCEKQLSQTKRKLKILQIQNKINKKKYTKVFKFMTKCRSKTELETKRDKEKVRYWKTQTNKIKQQTQTKLDNLKTAIETHEEIHRLNRLEITDLKDRLHDLELELEKDEHTAEIDLTKHSKFGRYTYTAETDLCIMELLNCHVPFDRVDTVIKSVLSLCKLKAKDETLPKKDYVSSVNVRRLAISQAHIAETCIEENRTLYTDETRKNGHSYGVFITSNENQEPCLLGLKHMSSKASNRVRNTERNFKRN